MSPAPKRLCFKCKGSPGQCQQRIVKCPYSANVDVCFTMQYTLARTGNDTEAFGCAQNIHCKTGCDIIARNHGRLTRCSISCCLGDLCNKRGLYSDLTDTNVFLIETKEFCVSRDKKLTNIYIASDTKII